MPPTSLRHPFNPCGAGSVGHEPDDSTITYVFDCDCTAWESLCKCTPELKPKSEPSSTCLPLFFWTHMCVILGPVSVGAVQHVRFGSGRGPTDSAHSHTFLHMAAIAPPVRPCWSMNLSLVSDLSANPWTRTLNLEVSLQSPTTTWYMQVPRLGVGVVVAREIGLLEVSVPGHSHSSLCIVCDCAGRIFPPECKPL